MTYYTDILSEDTYLELIPHVPLRFHDGDKEGYLEQVQWRINMSETGIERIMLEAVVPALSEALQFKKLLTTALDADVLQAHFSTDLSFIALEMMGRPEAFAPVTHVLRDIKTVEQAFEHEALKAVLLDLNAYQLLAVNVSSRPEVNA